VVLVQTQHTWSSIFGMALNHCSLPWLELPSTEYGTRPNQMLIQIQDSSTCHNTDGSSLFKTSRTRWGRNRVFGFGGLELHHSPVYDKSSGKQTHPV
jgi:hypothetical protein